jgi:hypothetical protein
MRSTRPDRTCTCGLVFDTRGRLIAHCRILMLGSTYDPRHSPIVKDSKVR